MSRRAWARLDNASNIFLAARSDADPKVFRMSAETDHEVDPALLQEALEETFERYPLYHAVLRRGIFWYYLQDSDLRPQVEEESLHTCAPIYQADRLNLLFRVMHFRRRIVLEVFHALSDGTGALWFLTDLLSAYMRLRFPDRFAAGTVDAATVSPLDPGQVPATRPTAPRDSLVEPEAEAGAGMPSPDPGLGLTSDSFAHHFRRRRGMWRPAYRPGADTSSGLSRFVGASTQKAHTVKGTRTPDSRTRVVELTMPTAEVLALSRAEKVSLTMYLTALFFEAVRTTSGEHRALTLAASLPVNLRQFFPSTSARNFFATVRIEHTYGQTPDDAGTGDGLGEVCRELEAQFRPQAAPDSLERKLRRFIRFERTLALRVVPRPLKDVALGLFNRASNRGLTVAVSNLGNVSLPPPVAEHVRKMLFHVSAVRPQFCAMSHAGVLTVSFTSPFTETEHVREFARLLTRRKVPVTVATARVTEAELAGTQGARGGASQESVT